MITKQEVGYDVIQNCYTVSGEKELNIFEYYKSTRSEQFPAGSRRFNERKLGVMYVKLPFYIEVTALHTSGLLKKDKHYQVLNRCLLHPKASQYFYDKLRKEFGKEVLKGSYLIAEALGMKECLKKLENIKYHKRKDTIE